MFLLGFLSVFIVSAQQPPACTYSYKPDSLVIEWTAYKFTEKKGVKVSFPTFKLNAPASAPSLRELFTQTSIEIDPLGVSSGDLGRDENLRTAFFKKMVGGKIKGTVVAYDPAISKIKIEMNGQSRVVPFRMKVEGTKYTAETDIDVMDFKMKKPMESLNKVCHDLHKGPDGKSKTWTQVSLNLSTEVIETCSK